MENYDLLSELTNREDSFLSRSFLHPSHFSNEQTWISASSTAFFRPIERRNTKSKVQQAYVTEHCEAQAISDHFRLLGGRCSHLPFRASDN